MEELDSMLFAMNRPIRTSMQARRTSMTSRIPALVEDMHREQRELFTWLAQYNHAVAQGVSRYHLLAIFEATFQCVKEHFSSVEALLERASWPRFQRHHVMHRRIAAELEAYRNRLASNEPLDAVESMHVLDALLIHCIKEQPVFNKLHARLNQMGAQ